MLLSFDKLLLALVAVALVYLAGSVVVRLRERARPHFLHPGSRTPGELLVMSRNPKTSAIRSWHLELERVTFRQKPKRAA